MALPFELSTEPGLARALLAALLATLVMTSLVIGAVLGAFRPPSRRVTAVIMAFGTGALIQALAIELSLHGALRLVHDAGFSGGGAWLWVAGGFLLGGVAYIGGNHLLDAHGAALRHPATAKEFLLERKRAELAPLLSRLAGVEVLRSLPPEDMEFLVPRIGAVSFGAGDRVFAAGDEGDALYVVDVGSVEVLSGFAGPTHPGGGQGGAALATRRLARLGPGESFGEMALLSGEPRTATVAAAEPAVLLRIAKADLELVAERSPDLRLALEELSARRMLENVRALAGEGEAERWQRAAVAGIQRMSRAEENRRLRQEAEASRPLAIFFGALLDGVPESVVIGAGFVSMATMNPTFLVAVFIANLPEAMASAVAMREAGFSRRRVIGLWMGLVLVGAVAAAAGNLFLTGAHPAVLTLVEALAGGAILALIATVMMPEAFRKAGPLVGLATIAGFLTAFYFTAIGIG
jgi:CRP-like cAMP-binding protein